jgi:hypothetical protein
MRKSKTKPLLLAFAFALAGGLSVSPAVATEAYLPPQVLGLIATATPVPLDCANGKCSTLLSSFCLQEDRPVPGDGQRYHAAGMGDVTVIITKTDGGTAEFSATGLVDFVSEGDFTRIRADMDQGRLASLGATSVAVRVQPMVSLLPQTDAPISADIAARDEEAAYGVPRMLAEGFFKQGLTRTDAALAIRRMVSALPPSADTIGSASREVRRSVWQKVTSGGALQALSQDGVKRAKGALDRCGAYADMGIKLTLRGCLENTHDKTLREVNDEYWKSDSAGY